MNPARRPAPAVGAVLDGVVADFDEEAGLGVVQAAHGDRFPFHCVAIADGSRSIAVGTPVRFRVAAGLPGTWEARALAGVGRAPGS